MQKFKILLIALVVFSFSCKQEKTSDLKTNKDKNGFEYKTVKNDPFGVREYTLKNGLKVFLSVNKDKPEVSTMIAVKAGSTYDPKETTGLAHYLEHMMFKGTDKIATSNWEKEKVILDKISDQFEKHKASSDKAEKEKIYAVIDSLSQEAAKYANPNEYDKLVSSLGAKRTNAFTSNERTVYVNTIPSNQIEKWVTLESERFSKLVLRLFHTELETVYEEFNSGQSSDFRQAYYKLNELLFPTHPYGTQTTIGVAEHLKNPSMVNIHNYWNKYYVANNMAIIMCGDLDPDETIAMIDKHFSKLRKDDKLSHPTFPKEKEITKPVKADVYGPDAEFIQIAFRTNGVKNQDKIKDDLFANILYNGQAGLMDIDLNKTQKVLKSYAYNDRKKDYGQLVIQAYPQANQTLEDVEKLVLGEIEKIKKGEFDDWLVEAIVNDSKLSELRQMEYNYYIYSILDAFITEVPWSEKVSELDKMEKITKQEIIDYAKKTFKDNYVVVYKRKGKNEKVVTVDKPKITPIDIDRNRTSEFYNNFTKLPETRLKPDFPDFKKQIKTSDYKGVEFNYIQNKDNELTSVNFILDMGRYNKKELELAMNYFEYAGTKDLSSEELAKEYYKLGVYTGAYVSGDRSYIYISGLNKNFKKALKLFVDNIKTAKYDKASFDNYINTLKKERANKKLDKWSIGSNLKAYAKYGEDNPARYYSTNKELDEINPDNVLAIINNMFNYKHYILYYGPNNFNDAEAMIKEAYTPVENLKDLDEEKQFTERETGEKVFFTDYDMVQSRVTFIAKDKKFNTEYLPYISLFNEFYGAGLSSIVFQEIRESKGLVYSAYSYMSRPDEKEKNHYLYAALATQPDKMKDAMKAMIDILNNMPKAEKQFEAAKKSALIQLESKRITKENIFWSYLAQKKLGLDHNIDKDVYNKIKEISYDDFKEFFKENIANKKFNIAVIGRKEAIDFNNLKKYGEIKELSLDELFNY